MTAQEREEMLQFFRRFTENIYWHEHAPPQCDIHPTGACGGYVEPFDCVEHSGEMCDCSHLLNTNLLRETPALASVDRARCDEVVCALLRAVNVWRMCVRGVKPTKPHRCVPRGPSIPPKPRDG